MRNSVVVVASCLIWQPVLADNYSVTVTRKGSNNYRVDGKGIFITTRYCYEYVYSADAILKMSGRTGEIHFVEEDEACPVKGVYGKVDVQPNEYTITVSREEDHWYRIGSSDRFIRTSMCLQLALGEDALLNMSTDSDGTLHFLDSDASCTVEGVFEQLRL
jgi:hypothetical protein